MKIFVRLACSASYMFVFLGALLLRCWTRVITLLWSLRCSMDGRRLATFVLRFASHLPWSFPFGFALKVVSVIRWLLNSLFGFFLVVVHFRVYLKGCNPRLEISDSVHSAYNGRLHCREGEKKSRTYDCMRVYIVNQGIACGCMYCIFAKRSIELTTKRVAS